MCLRNQTLALHHRCRLRSGNGKPASFITAGRGLTYISYSALDVLRQLLDCEEGGFVSQGEVYNTVKDFLVLGSHETRIEVRRSHVRPALLSAV